MNVERLSNVTELVVNGLDQESLKFFTLLARCSLYLQLNIIGRKGRNCFQYNYVKGGYTTNRLMAMKFTFH